MKKIISRDVLLIKDDSKETPKEVAEDVVIYDECGDTMWDKVLAQDSKVFNLQQPEKKVELMINQI